MYSNAVNEISDKLKELGIKCVIISNSTQCAVKAISEAMAYVAAAAEAAAVEATLRALEKEMFYDPYAEYQTPAHALLQQIIENEEIESLAAMGEDQVEIEAPRKTPRPPKRLGPVNKANYAANKPHRRARSSCYIRHR